MNLNLFKKKTITPATKGNDERNELFTFRNVDGSITITGYLGSDSIVEIPPKLNGTDITGIGTNAFRNNKKIQKIIFTDKMHSIGSSAFENCISLEEVVFPEKGLTSLYKDAFKGCSSLKTIELPTLLEVINRGAFENCSSLSCIGLPYALKKICEGSFKNCSSLNEIYHYSMRGISSVMFTDKELREAELPTGLEHIGADAFSGCSSMGHFSIPYKVDVIEARAFENCTTLHTVYLHNRLQEVKEKAFAGCSNLKELRLPLLTKKIADNAISENTTLVCESSSFANKFASSHKLQVRLIPDADLNLNSSMNPSSSISEDDQPAFYNASQLQAASEKFEIRHASFDLTSHPEKKFHVTPSRFTYENGCYHNNSGTKGQATIMMTGDLMCQPGLQRFGFDGFQYQFDSAFSFVSELLHQSDLTIGNLETTVAKSVPYCVEREHVNDRPHLNCPDAYLESVRNAGYDAVVNAQNHIYDSGVIGIFETLDCENKCQLMHTGAFASASDPRYLVIELNGIKVGIVSYLDGARQAMKKANFTKIGRESLISIFDTEAIQADVNGAKKDGAEFILAYSHWGREYTHNITDRQNEFAQELADAGVDFIFGSHSHCMQPYDVIESNDGRRVPVLYSGGSFLTNIDIHLPITRDTCIVELKIARDDSGKVQIVNQCYHPCRMEKIHMDGYDEPALVVIPTAKVFSDNVTLDRKLDAAERRIINVVGSQLQVKNPRPVSAIRNHTVPKTPKTKLEEKYEISSPALVHFSDDELPKPASKFSYNSETGYYHLNNNTGLNAATLICSGSLAYSSELESAASYGKSFSYFSIFKHGKKAIESGDVAIAPLDTMADDSYQTTGMLSKDLAVENAPINNSHPAYLDAIKYAGFDVLSLSGPHTLDLGINGLTHTIEQIERREMIANGILDNKLTLLEINNINVAIINFATSCNYAHYINQDGRRQLLNLYSKPTAQTLIKQAREKGADFVLVYVNSSSTDTSPALSERTTIGHDISDYGADFVIFTHNNILSKLETYTTQDQRQVPIATSLGSYNGGIGLKNGTDVAVLLKLKLYKDQDGKIYTDYNYIPCKKYSDYKGNANAIVPVLNYFSKGNATSTTKEVSSEVEKKLGKEIALNEERMIQGSTYFKQQITIAEICKVLDKPVPKKLKGITESTKKASNVVMRKNYLREGCVAVVEVPESGPLNHYTESSILIEDAVKAGATMVIATKQYDELPCVVVDNVANAFVAICTYIRSKYSPKTIALTGTVGKTTTKDLIGEIMLTEGKTLFVDGNYNTYRSAGECVQKLDKSTKLYVQEVHGGTIGSASTVSKMVQPNACLITNIGHGHIAQVGSFENLIREKMSITAGMQEDGVLFLNHDNETLAKQTPSVPVVWFSSFDSNCDYYAQNIVESGDKITFQICDHENAYDAVLNFTGIHNVNNAVGAFAVARWMDIPPYKIVAAMSRYQPHGFRQNTIDYRGYKVIVDCYSATPESVDSAMKAFAKLELPSGGRHIAVMGDVNDLGTDYINLHREIGRKAAAENIDMFFCYGKDAEFLAEGIAEKTDHVAYFDNRDEFNSALAEYMRPGDAVIFKASLKVALEKSVRMIFGKIV